MKSITNTSNEISNEIRHDPNSVIGEIGIIISSKLMAVRFFARTVAAAVPLATTPEQDQIRGK